MSAPRRTDVELLPHTVAALPGERGRRPGFLVRSLGSRRELGYLWCQNGQTWWFRTPDATGVIQGECATKRAALDQLCEFGGLPGATESQPQLPLTRERGLLGTPKRPRGTAPRVAEIEPAAPARRATPVPPAPPVEDDDDTPAPPIVWNDTHDAPDLMAALKAGFAGFAKPRGPR